MQQKSGTSLLSRFSYWALSIRTVIFLSLLLAAVSSSILTNMYYSRQSNQILKDEIHDVNYQLTSTIIRELDSLAEQCHTINYQLIEIAVIMGIVDDRERSMEEKLEFSAEVSERLKTLKRPFENIAELYIVDFNRTVFSTIPYYNSTIASEQWIRGVAEDPRNRIIFPSQLPTLASSTRQQYIIPFVRKINHMNDREEVQFVQLDLNYRALEAMMEGISLTGNDLVFIVDEHDRIIYHPDEDYLGRSLHDVEYLGLNNSNTEGFTDIGDEDGYLILNRASVGTGWQVIGIFSLEDRFDQLKSANRMSVMVILITILLSLVFSLFLSTLVTNPITTTVEAIKRVGEGKFNSKIPRPKSHDMALLTDSFNVMIDKIQILMDDIKEEEKQILRTELKAMQSQINSHFLYNTLNTVKMMALMKEDYEEIADVIVSLVKTLEYSYKGESRYVSIAAELDFIRDYVLIMNKRYKDGFEVVYDLEAGLTEKKILKLTLQPILENAIIHGIADRSEKAAIVISGRFEQEDMVFEISDNGKGMEVKNRDKLTGMGMNSVDQRIRLNYGENYGISVESEIGVGTTVRIVLPIAGEEAL